VRYRRRGSCLCLLGSAGEGAREKEGTWMGDDGKFAVGLLDLEFSCVGLDAEGIVVCSIDNHGDSLV